MIDLTKNPKYFYMYQHWDGHVVKYCIVRLIENGLMIVCLTNVHMNQKYRFLFANNETIFPTKEEAKKEYKRKYSSAPTFDKAYGSILKKRWKKQGCIIVD